MRQHCIAEFSYYTSLNNRFHNVEIVFIHSTFQPHDKMAQTFSTYTYFSTLDYFRHSQSGYLEIISLQPVKPTIISFAPTI